MFENSPVTKRILSYGNKRIGQFITPILHTKVLAINSAESPYPRLPIMHEARSREFKSITLRLANNMFDKDKYIYLSGDTTINSLKQQYGENLDGKCICVDDGNLLYNAMHKRSSNRWSSGLSVLYSEEKYKFGIERERFMLRGRISLIINLSAPAFYKHKNELFEVTLGDRLFIVHGWLTEEEHFRCMQRFKNTKKLKSGVFITERYNKTIKNLNEYGDELKAYAKDYAILSVRNPAECLDIVTALVSENARVNYRNYITEDEIGLVRILRPYNIDPMVPDEPRIIGYLKEGKTPTDICHLLHKPLGYRSTITYYKKRALKRGALDDI